ncbi:Uncharacterised protein [uncultured archaeon]|nr:Uncharacterised protein [uncultured archaeon]
MVEEKEKKKESLFLVSITGKNTHFEVPINDMSDFENLDEILRILKKKL